MPHQTEPNAHKDLGTLLRGLLSGSMVQPESTQIFPENQGRHEDVLIAASGASPVAVAAEYERGPEA